jgi:hypothetical protein
VYGEQVILVPFTFTYALNIQFENGSEAYLYWMANVQATDNASAAATRQAEASTTRGVRNNILVAGLIGVAVLLLAGWLLWSRFLHRR